MTPPPSPGGMLSKEIQKFAEVFASQEDGRWWGHDTDLGDCKEAFARLNIAISDALAQARRDALEECLKINERNRGEWVTTDKEIRSLADGGG